MIATHNGTAQFRVTLSTILDLSQEGSAICSYNLLGTERSIKVQLSHKKVQAKLPFVLLWNPIAPCYSDYINLARNHFFRSLFIFVSFWSDNQLQNITSFHCLILWKLIPSVSFGSGWIRDITAIEKPNRDHLDESHRNIPTGFQMKMFKVDGWTN